jgi:hypothetical protein
MIYDCGVLGQNVIIINLLTIFSLHDERIKNIEAKIRSKKNFCIILDECAKKKKKINNETTSDFNREPAFNAIMSNNEDQRQSDAKLKKQ